MQHKKTSIKEKTIKDKRQWNRELIEPPEKGIVFLHDKKEDNPHTLLVNVHDIGEAGVLLESPQKFSVHSSFYIRIWHPEKDYGYL